MKEIKTSDTSEFNKLGLDNYEKIKPETNIQLSDARNYWDKKFAGVEPSKVVDDKKEYFDDNGELYRVDNELIPNHEYTINGYEYKTDDNGRIISAGGKLQLRNRDRLGIRDSKSDIGKGDELETDDRGHLIADIFNGSNGLENMIPQDSKINRGEYRQLEEKLAEEVKKGRDVRVEIEPVYLEESHRPDIISFKYSIDGKISMVNFPNGEV